MARKKDTAAVTSTETDAVETAPEVAPEETKVEEAKVEEAKVEEAKVEEAKVEEAKVEEAKVEEAPAEVKVDDELAVYVARFPLGATFAIPGARACFTVHSEPVRVDGKIHAACVLHTGAVRLICIDGLLK